MKTLAFENDPQTQINEINTQLSTTVKRQAATFSGDMSSAQYLQLGTLENFIADQAPIKIHIYGKVLLSSLSIGDFDFEIIVPFTNIAQSNTARIIQYTNGVDESSRCVNQIILDGTAVIIKVAGSSDTVIPYNVLSIGSDFTISPTLLTDYAVNGSATVLNCETTGFQVAYGAIDTLTSKSITAPVANVTTLTTNTENTTDLTAETADITTLTAGTIDATAVNVGGNSVCVLPTNPSWVTSTSGSLTIPSSGWYIFKAINGNSSYLSGLTYIDKSGGAQEVPIGYYNGVTVIRVNIIAGSGMLTLIGGLNTDTIGYAKIS